MNFFKVFSVAVMFLGISQINAQKKETKAKSDVKQEAPKQNVVDNPTKCSNIKEGMFLRTNYPKSLWYMTVKDNIQTEYQNDGKDYIKSSMIFIDDCNYKLMVLEVKGEDKRIKVDDVFTNKVVATKDNYLKIESKIAGDTYNLVLVKVPEVKK
jgi:hypothetical protein